jgi:hypothetical protein
MAKLGKDADALLRKVQSNEGGMTGELLLAFRHPVGISLERRGYLNGRPVRNSDHHRIYSLTEKAVEYLREYPEA